MNARVSLFLRIAPLTAVLILAIACTKSANDAQVTSEIQSKPGADSGLQNKQLAVQAANGTVTLSGTVDYDAQREAAANYAAAASGVKKVINNLQVGTMSATADNKPSPSSQMAPAPPVQDEHAPVKSKAASSSSKHHRESAPPDQMAQAAPAPQPATSAPAPDPQPAAAPAPPPPEPQKVTVPTGTSLPVRLVDTITSATAQTGDTFHATLDSPISIDGDVVIPAHYEAARHVVLAQASGKFAGQALLELQLDRIKVGDRWYNIQTDHFKQQTGSRGKNTAEKVGGGAIAGAILGGIFGGGKGAAIGSVAGAGAGGGVQAASKKPDIKLSSEKILTFTLQAPVTLVPTNKTPREGHKLE